MPLVFFADVYDVVCSYKRAKELEETIGKDVVVGFETTYVAGHDTFLNNDPNFLKLVISHLSANKNISMSIATAFAAASLILY